MKKATIIVEVDEKGQSDQSKEFEKWKIENLHSLTFISENEGCGCCVDIYRVEGPQQIISTIPPKILGGSEWDNVPAGESYNEYINKLEKSDKIKEGNDKRNKNLQEARDLFRKKKYSRACKIFKKYKNELNFIDTTKLDYAKRHKKIFGLFN